MSQADPFAAYRVGETPDPFAAYRVTTPAAAPPLSREQLMRMSPRELRASGIAPKDLVALMGMRESERTNRGVELLPVVGGIVGGMAGGVPGAALGGAAGEAYRQLSRRATGQVAPATPRAAAIDLLKQGALQGLTEGAGRVIAAGVGKTGTYLMNRALNPPDRLAREFPDLSKTLIDHVLTVSQGGFQKARRLLQQAKVTANAALHHAEQQGVTVPLTAATQGLTKTLDAVIESADPIGGLNALARIERKMFGGRGPTVTPTQADALKRRLQAEARTLYRAVKMGQGKGSLKLAAEGAADMAHSLNAALEQATTAAGATGYNAANFAAQEMIGATRALRHAIRPGKTLYQAMVRPGVGAVIGGTAGQTKGHPVAGAIAGAALTSPLGMSLVALGLTRPVVTTLFRQLPRGLLTAITQWAPEAEGATPPPDSAAAP